MDPVRPSSAQQVSDVVAPCAHQVYAACFSFFLLGESMGAQGIAGGMLLFAGALRSLPSPVAPCCSVHVDLALSLLCDLDGVEMLSPVMLLSYSCSPQHLHGGQGQGNEQAVDE
mmetsp:Transcript_15890/g.53165  ORF Transcript_15890/g.53165 Transcript_15890/m.53165 type:complete len:114 (-) Transcript_15890:9-350(-)